MRGYLLLLLLLLAWTAAWGQEPPRSGNPDRGMFIFSAYCATCHGEDGLGDGPMAPRLIRDFGIGPTNLAARDFQRARTDAGLTKAIAEGSVAVHRSIYMPAWGLTLSEGQIADLVAFVRELGEPVKSQEAPGSVVSIQTHLELGRTLYTLYCSACHGPQGKGDGPLLAGMRDRGEKVKPLPDLSKRSFWWNLSDRQLAERIRTGFGHSGFFAAGSRTRWWHRALDAGEYDALILYVRSLPLRTTDR